MSISDIFDLKGKKHWIQSWVHCFTFSNITSGFNKTPVCSTYVLKTAWKPNQQREGITLDYPEICIVWNGLWWPAFMNGWFYLWGTSSGLIISTSFCVTSAILNKLKYEALKQSKLDSEKTRLGKTVLKAYARIVCKSSFCWKIHIGTFLWIVSCDMWLI